VVEDSNVLACLGSLGDRRGIRKDRSVGSSPLGSHAELEEEIPVKSESMGRRVEVPIYAKINEFIEGDVRHSTVLYDGQHLWWVRSELGVEVRSESGAVWSEHDGVLAAGSDIHLAMHSTIRNLFDGIASPGLASVPNLPSTAVTILGRACTRRALEDATKGKRWWVAVDDETGAVLQIMSTDSPDRLEVQDFRVGKRVSPA
jgi:hypothetical protein